MPKFSAYMKGGDGSAGPPGASFISGIVATTSQLPPNPPENRQIYLVGNTDPKHIYAYIDGQWVDQGLTASEIARTDASIRSIGWTEDPSVQVSFSSEDQKDYFNFDFAIPKTRPAGFGTSNTASATTIAFGATPIVSVTNSGEDYAKNFHFDFKIPAGEPAGFGTPHVQSIKVPSGTDPTVEITTVTSSPERAKEFNFKFGIPEGVAAGFSTQQNVSVSTLDTGEQATVQISTVTTSPETSKVFNFHFGLPRGDALSIYDGITFTSTQDGYNYYWKNTNGTSTLVFSRGSVEKLPIYIYNNNDESIASTFKISTTTIEYEADEKFDGTMYLMMPATLQNIEIGNVSSTTYGYDPIISKSTGSTSTNLILDFTIPDGYPGRSVIDSMTTNIQSITTNINSLSTNINSLSTDKVNKSGDTITGDLYIKNPDAESASTSFPQVVYRDFGFKDKNNDFLAFLEANQNTDGENRLWIGARKKINSSNINNSLTLGVSTDGTRFIDLDAPDIWRNAIGAVNKAGDTMVGDLVVSDHHLYVKRNISNISATSISAPQYAIIGIKDKNDELYGYIQATQYADGSTLMQISARNRQTGGTGTFDNGFGLKCNKDGTKSVALGDQNAWLNALGLTDSGWKTATMKNSTTGSIYYRKIGNIVNVICYDIKMGQAVNASYLNIATIPDGYRPKVACFTVGMQHSGAGVYMWKINIMQNGDIYVYSSGDTIASGAQFSFNATYMIP